MTELENVTAHMSDRLFDEVKMYTYLKGYMSAKGLYQSMRLMPYFREMHKNQQRGGHDHVPYFSHPLQLASHAIALGFDDDDLISTCLLHDVCEDCGVAPEDLPCNQAVREAVALLTKQHAERPGSDASPEELLAYGEEKHQINITYYEGIRTNRLATIVKMLDRCHNLSSMAFAWDPSHLASYILETEEFVYPLIEFAKNEYPELDNQIYLVKYHMRSVVEAVRHMLAVLEVQRLTGQV